MHLTIAQPLILSYFLLLVAASGDDGGWGGGQGWWWWWGGQFKVSSKHSEIQTGCT